MHNLLLIETDKQGTSLASYLKRLGYNITARVCDADQAIENAKIFNPDFIVMDYDLNEQIDGKNIYDRIKQQNSEIPIIYMSSPAVTSL